MAATDTPQPTGLTDLPRAVLSAAAEVLHTVGLAMIGEARVRTARGNAWEAVCADRERARSRAETRRLVADLAVGAAVRPQLIVGTTAAELVAATARPQVVGSSPRSRASQASLVGSAARG